jgi:carbon storage regulator
MEPGARAPIKEGWIMLVLTRRVGETIVVDGDIRITFADISRNKVRLSIDAPPYIRVDRKEIHDRRAELDRQELEASMTRI